MKSQFQISDPKLNLKAAHISSRGNNIQVPEVYSSPNNDIVYLFIKKGH